VITIVPFQPTATQVFTFIPTLDGIQYNLAVTWNLGGRRWYINLLDLTGDLILCRSMSASPDDYDINLVEYYFVNSTLVYRDSTNSFEVAP
jgi:hypothetical protein